MEAKFAFGNCPCCSCHVLFSGLQPFPAIALCIARTGCQSLHLPRLNDCRLFSHMLEFRYLLVIMLDISVYIYIFFIGLGSLLPIFFFLIFIVIMLFHVSFIRIFIHHYFTNQLKLLSKPNIRILVSYPIEGITRTRELTIIEKLLSGKLAFQNKTRKMRLNSPRIDKRERGVAERGVLLRKFPSRSRVKTSFPLVFSPLRESATAG